ncbi:MAG: hypothetical protein ACT4QC_02310 [Planctomycetaceae bacterium]
MNIFDFAIRDLGLQPHSSGEHAALYLALCVARDLYAGPNVLSNPYREIQRRWASYSNSLAYREFANILERKASAYNN